MALPIEKQFIELVKKSERPLIILPKEHTNDGIAASVALSHILQKYEKNADIIAEGFSIPKTIQFLKKTESIKSNLANLQTFILSLDVSKTKIDELSYHIAGDKLRIHLSPKSGAWNAKDINHEYASYKYDLIFTVECSDYTSLGSCFEHHAHFFHHTPVINIDHNPQNERFGNINIVDVTASSVTEILYALFHKTGDPFLNEEIATSLLAGIIAKTKSFKTQTVTPRTLDIAARLIAAGAKREEIIRNFYRTKSVASLKLWGRALARLKYDAQTKLAHSILVQSDFAHAGANDNDLPDIIDELMLHAPEAESAAVLYEKEGNICILLGTPQGKLSRLCFEKMTMPEAEKKFLTSLPQYLAQQ